MAPEVDAFHSKASKRLELGSRSTSQSSRTPRGLPQVPVRVRRTVLQDTVLFRSSRVDSQWSHEPITPRRTEAAVHSAARLLKSAAFELASKMPTVQPMAEPPVSPGGSMPPYLAHAGTISILLDKYHSQADQRPVQVAVRLISVCIGGDLVSFSSADSTGEKSTRTGRYPAPASIVKAVADARRLYRQRHC